MVIALGAALCLIAMQSIFYTRLLAQSHQRFKAMTDLAEQALAGWKQANATNALTLSRAKVVEETE